MLWVCEAYFQQRHRTQYDECTKRMWRLIPEDWYQINDHDMKANLLTRRAELRLEIQDYDEAKRLIEQAIDEVAQGKSTEMLGTSHISIVVRVYQVAGIISAFTGDRAGALAAIDKIDRSVATEEVWGGRDQMLEEFEYEIRRDAMGTVLVALKDYEEAVKIFASTYERKRTFNSVMDSITTFGLIGSMEDIAKDLTSSYNNSRKIPIQFVIAKANLEAGNLEVAKGILDGLLAIPLTAGFSEVYSATNYERGRIARLEGDLTSAVEHFELAITEIEKQRKTVNTEAGKIGFAGDSQVVYWDMVNAQIELGQLEAAFTYAERAKSRALVDMLAEKEAFGAKGSQRSKLALDAVEMLRMNDLENQVYSREDYNRLKKGTRGVAIQTLDAPKLPDKELASLLTVTSIDLQQLTDTLRPDETLIEFYGYNNEMLAFVLTNGRLSVVAIDASSLNGDVAALRKGLQDPAGNDYAYYSNKLFVALLQPVLSKETSNNLIIVPHGVLHYLPFSVLGTPERTVINNYSYRVIPSASVLLFLNRTKEVDSRLLVLGNPDLNNSDYDLPFAEREALAIAEQKPGARVLVREQATETEVRNAAQRFSQIHIASHGIFDDLVPLNSRLLLSSDQTNDGNLTVSELYDLDLNADIVTLSACETGLGEVSNGDDVIGFTRGFLFAGAQTIVSSLWKVDDLATMQLMLKFYDELESKPAREALRLAQQHLIENGRAHPYYWAAFQVTGADI